MSAGLAAARALLALAGVGSVFALVHVARSDESALAEPREPRERPSSERRPVVLPPHDGDRMDALAALVPGSTAEARDAGFLTALLQVRVVVDPNGTAHLVGSEEALASRVRGFVEGDEAVPSGADRRTVVLLVEAVGSSSGPLLFDRTLGDAAAWRAASDRHLSAVRRVAELAPRVGARAVCAFPNGSRMLDPSTAPELRAARLETWREGLAAVRAAGVEAAAVVHDGMAELAPERVAELDLRVVLAQAVVEDVHPLDRALTLASAASLSPPQRLLAVDADWRLLERQHWQRALRR